MTEVAVDCARRGPHSRPLHRTLFARSGRSGRSPSSRCEMRPRPCRLQGASSAEPPCSAARCPRWCLPRRRRCRRPPDKQRCDVVSWLQSCAKARFDCERARRNRKRKQRWWRRRRWPVVAHYVDTACNSWRRQRSDVIIRSGNHLKWRFQKGHCSTGRTLGRELAAMISRRMFERTSCSGTRRGVAACRRQKMEEIALDPAVRCPVKGKLLFNAENPRV